MSKNFEKRLERIESKEEIKDLSSKYSLALDVRDLDSLVNLFPENIMVGKGESGRLALKRWFDHTLRSQFTGTAHHVGNKIIEFLDDSHAIGVVYSKNEHETGKEWIIMQMMYWDEYEKIDKRWYFRRRLPLYWYATDLNKPPIGNFKMRWPGIKNYEGGFHSIWPTWKEFWDSSETKAVSEPVPLEEFLRNIRRGSPDPSIKVK